MTNKKFCSRCGCELQETNLNKWYCANCGMIEENQNIIEKSDNKEVSYIR